MKKKLTLKEAKKTDKIKQFIKEHAKDEPADKERFKKTISSVSQGKKK